MRPPRSPVAAPPGPCYLPVRPQEKISATVPRSSRDAGADPQFESGGLAAEVAALALVTARKWQD